MTLKKDFTKNLDSFSTVNFYLRNSTKSQRKIPNFSKISIKNGISERNFYSQISRVKPGKITKLCFLKKKIFLNLFL